MATTVNDYSIVESDDYAEFVEAVAAACSTEGWSPQGGLCIWYEPGDAHNTPIVHYAQALVKYAQGE